MMHRILMNKKCPVNRTGTYLKALYSLDNAHLWIFDQKGRESGPNWLISHISGKVNNPAAIQGNQAQHQQSEFLISWEKLIAPSCIRAVWEVASQLITQACLCS